MNAKLLRWIGAILTAMMAVLFSSFFAPAQASAKAGCLPDIGKRLPVILIHGFGDRAAVWGSADDPNSTLHEVDNLFNVYAETFDYETTNRHWVDDANIGTRLAQRIACIATSSRQAGGPGKVTLVVHSMGGLAARYAATQTMDGRSLSSDIGLVATIGTPNTGSGLADAGSILCSPIAETRKLEQSAEHDNSICTGGAVDAMHNHSQQIDDLPQLPSTIPVVTIAGDVTVTYSVFRVPLNDTDSDLVVTKPSALKGAAKIQSIGGEKVVACSTNIQSIDPVAVGMGIGQTAGKLAFKQPVLPSCWHNGLPSHQEVKQSVTDAIKAYQSKLKAQADAANANQALAPYIGVWTVHGGKLEIRSDRTGTQTISLGCGAAAICNEVVQLSFAGPSNGSLTAKINRVSVPDGYQPSVKVGDSFTLTLQRDRHVLHTIWSDGKDHGNPFWCDAFATTQSFTECGQ